MDKNFLTEIAQTLCAEKFVCRKVWSLNCDRFVATVTVDIRETCSVICSAAGKVSQDRTVCVIGYERCVKTKLPPPHEHMSTTRLPIDHTGTLSGRSILFLWCFIENRTR